MCIRDSPAYMEKKILKVDPFQVLDQEGVGQLIKMAVENGRATRPNLRTGICLSLIHILWKRLCLNSIRNSTRCRISLSLIHISYDFNTADKMHCLLVNALLATGHLKSGQEYDFDFDHQFLSLIHI